MAISLSFDVKVEAYGALTIDNLMLTGLPSGASRSLSNPPLTQAVLGNPPTGGGVVTPQDQASGAQTNQPNTPAQQQGLTISRPYGLWFLQVQNILNQLGAVNGVIPISFECPSLDDSDMDWGATATVDATSDPVQVTVETWGKSIYGRKFAVGDYIVWNDPKSSGNNFLYEINKITAIAGNSFTLQRAPVGSSGGSSAQFGSMKFAHANKNFFRCIDKFFVVNWNGVTGTYELPWYNKCVLAVNATMTGLSAPVLVNLAPLNSSAPNVGQTTTPPCPGLRTLTGSEYGITLSGVLSVGAIADAWLPITGPESIRSAFGKLSIAPIGSPATVALIYRTPDGSAAGLIEMVTWAPGSYYSYDIGANRPDQRRQMPYHDGWTPTNQSGLDYPPTLLPQAINALLPSGELNPAYTGTVNPAGLIPFLEGGWWSFICIACGSTTPGTVEVVALQT